MKVASIDKAVAEGIRERRQEIGASQRECAEAIGVCLNQFKKYESGENRLSAGRLYKLAAFLGSEVSDLFEGIDPGVQPILRDPMEPFTVRDEVMALNPKTRRAVRQLMRAASGSGELA